MADLESNSLIDWSGPVVEYLNKPLIPLTSFDNPIDIAEDNPFDAVERQVNENELLDVLNMNLSFNNHSNSEDPIHVVPDEIIVECVDTVLDRGNGVNGDCVDKDALPESPKKCESDALENSFMADLSDLSDFKEMIQSRISCCMNQAFRSNNLPKDSASSSSENENILSSIPTIDDSFILRSSELKDSDLLQNVEGECEDLQSIKLNWDDYIMSSSDEENEKVVLEKPKVSNLVKKSTVKLVSKIKDVRAPLVCQDPNIRIKKSNVPSKQGPLKAIAPVSCAKKMDDRKSTQINTNVRVMTSSKLKITPTNQSKLKKWTSPVATSTPQNLQNSKTFSPSFIRRSLISSPSPVSTIQKQNQTFSHPPSPDSTTDSKILSRSASTSRITPKNHSKNISSNLVSSSTKDSSKISVKTSKDVGARSIVRNVRNKENVKPFRY